jgi:hypothetical protein
VDLGAALPPWLSGTRYGAHCVFEEYRMGISKFLVFMRFTMGSSKNRQCTRQVKNRPSLTFAVPGLIVILRNFPQAKRRFQ